MPNKPVVFISYSHKDEKEKDELVKHLKVLHNEFDIWVDDNIPGGEKWEQKIESAIGKADMGIFLVSANFLTSEFIANNEVPVLLRRCKRGEMYIYPVVATDCAWDRIGWLSEFNVRPKNRMPVFRNGGDFANEELAKIANETGEILKAKKARFRILTSMPLELPFTNRIDEIEKVTSNTAPPYHILDAPAGYGKTMLLKGIEQRFRKKNWITALVSIKGGQDKKDIIINLLKNLELDDTKLLSSSNEQVDEIFGELLFDKWIDSNDGTSGIVFLFDIDGTPTDDFEYIVSELILASRKSLKNDDYFERSYNAFRVVFTGRYLARERIVSSFSAKANIDFRVIKLAPFDLKVIKETISKHKYFRKVRDSVLRKIAADLFFATGGHPKCISEIINLQIYKKAARSSFVEDEDLIIWNSVIEPTVFDVRQSVPSDLLSKLDALCLLRRWDTTLLQLMIENHWKKSEPDLELVKLIDSLLETRFMERNFSERVFEDGITRRLLSVFLRHELPQNEFVEKCEQLEGFCWRRISDRTLQNPEKWFAEILFQHIQKNVHSIFDIHERKKNTQNFFLVYLPKALAKFILDRGDKWEEDKYALLDWLKQDWEFRFTLNYYLRGDNFDDVPFQKLLEFLKNFSFNRP